MELGLEPEQWTLRACTRLHCSDHIHILLENICPGPTSQSLLTTLWTRQETKPTKSRHGPSDCTDITCRGKLRVFLPPCCAGLHLCLLSLSETQRELGSHVMTRGPSSSSVMTNVLEEPSYFATQPKFPFRKDPSMFLCFLNSHQPKMQPHFSLSEKPLLRNDRHSFTLKFIHLSNKCLRSTTLSQAPCGQDK